MKKKKKKSFGFFFFGNIVKHQHQTGSDVKNIAKHQHQHQHQPRQTNLKKTFKKIIFLISLSLSCVAFRVHLFLSPKLPDSIPDLQFAIGTQYCGGR